MPFKLFLAVSCAQLQGTAQTQEADMLLLQQTGV
jgi:hypothetical protein